MKNQISSSIEGLSIIEDECSKTYYNAAGEIHRMEGPAQYIDSQCTFSENYYINNIRYMDHDRGRHTIIIYPEIAFLEKHYKHIEKQVQELIKSYLEDKSIRFNGVCYLGDVPEEIKQFCTFVQTVNPRSIKYIEIPPGINGFY